MCVLVRIGHYPVVPPENPLRTSICKSVPCGKSYRLNSLQVLNFKKKIISNDLEFVLHTWPVTTYSTLLEKWATVGST